jgi:hypothetical protein
MTITRISNPTVFALRRVLIESQDGKKRPVLALFSLKTYLNVNMSNPKNARTTTPMIISMSMHIRRGGAL